MRRSSSLIRAVLLPTLVLFLGVSWTLRAAEPEPKKKFFRPDAPDMPAYSLPDVLTAIDGRKIATAQDWITIRRPEILELFRKHVYGRVPATEYQKSFRLVRQDPGAMDGAATLKQIEITITAAGKSLTIHLTLFVPNKPAKPVPTFLLICNRGPENIDPTRKTKSEFWPAEEVIARAMGLPPSTTRTWTPTRTMDSRTASTPCSTRADVRPTPGARSPPGLGARAAAWTTSRPIRTWRVTRSR